MSRLYYPKPTSAAVAAAAPARSSETPAKQYLEKVAKLVPAEVVAAYTSIIGFVPSIQPATWQGPFYWGAVALGTIATFFYMFWQADKTRPYGMHLLISTVAFVVWAYATSGDRLLQAPYYQAPVASIVLILFTLASGAIPLQK